MSKKEDKNKDKQIEIKNKILDILNINENNKSIILYDMDKNMELQNAILSLEKDCEKYFACSNWTYFVYKRLEKESERKYLILLKNILSACKIEYVNKSHYIKINDERIKTVKYIFI